VILHLMSTFPPYSQTFVMGEVRELRNQGWDIRIGCLRPLRRTPAAKGFEDLEPIVARAEWFNLEMLRGLLDFTFSSPGSMLACIRLVIRSWTQPISFLKLSYLLLVSTRLAHQFKTQPVTLIRGHFLHSEAVAARFLNILLGIPYSLTMCTAHVAFPRPVIRKVLESALFLVADNPRLVAFPQTFGLPSARVHVALNSVNVKEFPQRHTKTAAPRPLILAVGRLEPKKGFDVLFRACALLRDRGVPFKTLLVGEGPEQDRLRQLRNRQGLQDQIELSGKLSFEEIKPWFYRAAVFVMPSVVSRSGDVDGLPTVVLEAMASGLPVIGTSVGAISEAVLDGITGFIVPPNDPIRLAERLQQLLKDEGLRFQFGATGRCRAEEKFDLQYKAEVLSSLFQRYCAPKGDPNHFGAHTCASEVVKN